MLGFLSRFVDSNERELKRIEPFVDEANALEPELEALSDAEIRARFADIRGGELEGGGSEPFLSDAPLAATGSDR